MVMRIGPNKGWKLDACAKLRYVFPNQIWTINQAMDCRDQLVLPIGLESAGKDKGWERVTMRGLAIPRVHKVKSNPEKHMDAMPMKKTNWVIIARKDLLTGTQSQSCFGRLKGTHKTTTWFETAKNANLWAWSYFGVWTNLARIFTSERESKRYRPGRQTPFQMHRLTKMGQASQRTRKKGLTVVLGEPLYSQRKIRKEDDDKREVKTVPHLLSKVRSHCTYMNV